MTKKDDVTPIGRRIKQLRESLNLSQKTLGKLVGVTDAAITFWELGQRTPRGNNLKKLAKALGVTEAELYQDNSSELSSNPEAEHAIIRITIQECIRNMSNDDLKAVLAFVLAMNDSKRDLQTTPNLIETIALLPALNDSELMDIRDLAVGFTTSRTETLGTKRITRS
ncbi:MAG: helix-turn-helix transcriptional regulator [Nitrosomonas sp.]|nr:helix-turn-helix transcriptional regulator [Nitrosomonas sp.]